MKDQNKLAGQRAGGRVLLVSAVLGIAAAFICPAVALGDVSTVWSRLSQVIPHISTSKIQWHRVIITPPSPLDPALAGARVADYVTRHGGTADQARGEAEIASQQALRRSAGTVQEATLSFLHAGTSTRCEVKDAAPKLMNGTPDKDPTAYDIDILDDKKAVTLSGYRKDGEMIGTAAKASNGGLPHSACRSGDLQFFAGAALADVFSAQDTQASTNQNGDIVLHKAFGANDYHRIATLTVSSKLGYPVKMEETYPGENKVRMRYVASKFHRYSSGINFPSVITITHYAVNGAVMSEEQYNLITANFNQQIAPSAFFQINKGSSIRDTRFKLPVTYTVRGTQMPSDEAVLERVTSYEQSIASQRHYAQSSNGKLMVIALLLGIAGMFLWVRSSHRLRSA